MFNQTGFPSSNQIDYEQMKNSVKVGLVGFASKGPINTPILIKDLKQLRNTFGTASSQMLYAAEQILLFGAEIYIYRASDPNLAQTASASILGNANLIKIESSIKGPYVFRTSRFFRWKLNGFLSQKTLVVLATEDDGISARALADELNEQLDHKDGIQFYVHDKDYIAVQTTIKSNSELELISVQDSFYGPWRTTGLEDGVEPAEKVSLLNKNGLYDFTKLYNCHLQLEVNGTDDPNIEGVPQTVNLRGLEGKTNTIDDVVDYINIVEMPISLGGWQAFSRNGVLAFRTLHTGENAAISIKPGNLASTIFGFDNVVAHGKSPKTIFSANPSHNDEISLTVCADSPGEEGNHTRVEFINDKNSFTLNVYSHGKLVETWTQLTKNQEDSLYVETFVNLVSQWVRVIDNKNNPNPPKNGSFLLGEKIACGAKGSDGIPTSQFDQDVILIGNCEDQTGIYTFINPEYFDLDLIAIPGQSSRIVINSLLDVCTNRKDCLAIIDPPFEMSTPEEVISWSKFLTSEYGAVFWPWVQLRDTNNSKNIWAAPSGAIISAILRTHFLSPPWMSLTRAIVPGIIDVFYNVSSSDQDMLRSSKINFITNPKDRFIINSQKTLSNKNINIKRMLMYLEKKLRRAVYRILDLSGNDLSRKITQVCEYVLGQMKNMNIIHTYNIRTNELNDEFQAKIGVRTSEVGDEEFIDFRFCRQGKHENAETYD